MQAKVVLARPCTTLPSPLCKDSVIGRGPILIRTGPPRRQPLGGGDRYLARHRFFRLGQDQAQDAIFQLGFDLALVDHL